MQTLLLTARRWGVPKVRHQCQAISRISLGQPAPAASDAHLHPWPFGSRAIAPASVRLAWDLTLVVPASASFSSIVWDRCSLAPQCSTLLAISASVLQCSPLAPGSVSLHWLGPPSVLLHCCGSRSAACCSVLSVYICLQRKPKTYVPLRVAPLRGSGALSTNHV